MEKEFIPYEQALALKELGFDKPCFMFYEQGTKDKHLQQGIDSDYWGDYSGARDWNSMLNKPYKPFCKCISAPLFQQAFRWFREKYNLHGITFKNRKNMLYNEGIKTHSYTIMGSYNDILYNTLSNEYKLSFEEAELECLKELIEIVKN